MQYSTQESIILEKKSTSEDILLISQLRRNNFWFISFDTNPVTLINKLLINVGIPGLHLIGRFTEDGFKIAGRTIQSSDFPVFEQSQPHRTITFWCNDAQQMSGINEPFIHGVLQNTNMLIVTCQRESMGSEFSRRVFKINSAVQMQTLFP